MILFPHRSGSAQHLLLVGGFGESPYLRLRLNDSFGIYDTQVITIDEPSYVTGYHRLLAFANDLDLETVKKRLRKL